MKAANYVTALPLLHCPMNISACDSTIRRTTKPKRPPSLACGPASTCPA